MDSLATFVTLHDTNDFIYLLVHLLGFAVVGHCVFNDVRSG